MKSGLERVRFVFMAESSETDRQLNLGVFFPTIKRKFDQPTRFFVKKSL